MKVFKRNAVIITVLLFVCVAVYLNWSYNRGQELSNETADATVSTSDNAKDEDSESTDNSKSSIYYEESDDSGTTSSSGYFDEARLSRDQARDSATTLLQEVAATDTASQEEIDSAVSSITAMANYSVIESKIESNLLAKGYEDCVVFISDGAANVYVSAPEEGLSDVSVAQVTDAVMAEYGITSEQIKIIEIN